MHPIDRLSDAPFWFQIKSRTTNEKLGDHSQADQRESDNLGPEQGVLDSKGAYCCHSRSNSRVSFLRFFGLPHPGRGPRGYLLLHGGGAFSVKREHGQDPVEINNRTRGSGSSRLDSILERVNAG
jgi:hypothetical protein